jgi:hypothetical protein
MTDARVLSATLAQLDILNDEKVAATMARDGVTDEELMRYGLVGVYSRSVLSGDLRNRMDALIHVKTQPEDEEGLTDAEREFAEAVPLRFLKAAVIPPELQQRLDGPTTTPQIAVKQARNRGQTFADQRATERAALLDKREAPLAVHQTLKRQLSVSHSKLYCGGRHDLIAQLSAAVSACPHGNELEAMRTLSAKVADALETCRR